MREIKFRGKTNKGEWVYGDLHLLCDAPHIHTEISSYPYAGKRAFIDTSTIGQFTGLRDAKGNEIYEGDILFLEDDEVPFGCVAWHPDGYFAIDRHFGKYDFSKFKCRPLGEMLNRELDNGTILRFIVDGNVHDGLTI